LKVAVALGMREDGGGYGSEEMMGVHESNVDL